ncbi:MAG: HNH endonuclease, partial [bacterium]
MNLFVGITDREWYEYLAGQPGLKRINFWQPGGHRQFRALDPGEPFLFKLRGERARIVGGGYFVYSGVMRLSQAWDYFGKGNGAPSLDVARSLIGGLRADRGSADADFEIGCIALIDPFFLSKEDWFDIPGGWPQGIQSGRRYPLESPAGQHLWQQVQYRLAGRQLEDLVLARDAAPEYSQVMRRKGQDIFRETVARAYRRRCAVTQERVTPVLEAAHIKPYAKHGPNRVQNGLFLRADLHKLFDDGYATLTPDADGYRFRVSPTIRSRFHNGDHYRALDGTQLAAPRSQLEV